MTTTTPQKSKAAKKKIRYAVVGLGHIAQVAVLPAFAHTRQNSELVALVSGNETKLKKLGKMYDVEQLYSYEEYDRCLKSGAVDAVYIALPNHLHREYSVRAAHAGVHVLCEKPMAVTEAECEAMIKAADTNNVRLMIAYRLHFEEANLRAIEIINSGKLGAPRIFNAVFSMQVKEGDVRLQKAMGGGTLYDIGIYCINAARYLFQDEPTEVIAMSANNGESRFHEVDEITSAILRFPGERLATFTSSFGSATASTYQVVGTKGNLLLDPAFEYAGELKHQLTIEGKKRERTFAKRDHFAAELIYFSECILNNTEPQPSGSEGLADVRIIRALYRSAATSKAVPLEDFNRIKQRPTMQQEIKRPPAKKPKEIRV